jgi:carbamate kinase
VLIVVALGGNALLQRGETPSAEIQQHHVVSAVAQLRPLFDEHTLVITHGNGPQVGMLALESASDPVLDHAFPFDALGAQTQGMIGYWLAQAVGNALPGRRVASLVSQCVVDASDPAFLDPSKFVGRGYRDDEAVPTQGAKWTMKRDGALLRRVVASPEPREIVEIATIRDLAHSGVVVICAGGGGVPVLRGKDGTVHGVEAVIDKDLASAVLARELHADALMLLTDVAAVMADYGTDHATEIRSATIHQLRAASFAAGSMGPKVEAVCRFVEATGHLGVIGSIDDAKELLAGASGTTVVR